METLGGNTEEQVLPPGTMLEGKYRLESLLGAGGMGSVYSAIHTRLDKKVAVKVLQRSLAGRGEMVQRMLQEARAAGSIGHPNIVAVTDLGEHAGAPFIVMEFLEGESLSKRLKRGRMKVEEAVPLVVQALDALAIVHDKGIVHRDLKPDNIMIVPGAEGRPTVKILDFGISKRIDPDERGQVHTVTGTVMGTPAYMSPEQALGLQDIDGRSDLHSMGSLLYALLVGRPPYRGPNATATLARIMEGKFTAASSVVASIPEDVDAVLARALARDREKRFPNAVTMRAALRELLEDEPPESKPYVPTGLEDPVVVPMKGETRVALHRPKPAAWSESASSGRSSRMRVESVASAPRAGDDGPSQLQLDVPQGWKPGGATASEVPSPTGGNKVAWGWYALMIGLVVAGMGTWFFARKIDDGFDALEQGLDGVEIGDDADDSVSAETVLILVDPDPKDAIVYVDGVQRDERPIEVPKSDEPLQIRAEATGYAPYQVQLTPQRTRRVQLKLEKQ